MLDAKVQRLNPADAIMATAILAAATDKKLTPTEFLALQVITDVCPLFFEIEDVEAYIQAIALYIGEFGVEKVLDEIVDILPMSLRETAFAWAVMVAHADQKVRPEEHKYLSLLKDKFGLHGELAGKIAAMVAMLSRAK
jgi:tellurite resistance protein